MFWGVVLVFYLGSLPFGWASCRFRADDVEFLINKAVSENLPFLSTQNIRADDLLGHWFPLLSNLDCTSGVHWPVEWLDREMTRVRCRPGWEGHLCTERTPCPMGYRGWPTCTRVDRPPNTLNCTYVLEPDGLHYRASTCLCQFGFTGGPHACERVALPPHADTCEFKVSPNGMDWVIESCKCQRGFRNAPTCDERVLFPPRNQCDVRLAADGVNYEVRDESCRCQPPWQLPPECTTCQCNLQNTEQCMEDGSQSWCQCRFPFFGKFCELVHTPSQCDRDSTCVRENTLACNLYQVTTPGSEERGQWVPAPGSCVCRPGYRGPRCEETVRAAEDDFSICGEVCDQFDSCELDDRTVQEEPWPVKIPLVDASPLDVEEATRLCRSMSPGARLATAEEVAIALRRGAQWCFTVITQTFHQMSIGPDDCSPPEGIFPVCWGIKPWRTSFFVEHWSAADSLWYQPKGTYPLAGTCRCPPVFRGERCEIELQSPQGCGTDNVCMGQRTSECEFFLPEDALQYTVRPNTCQCLPIPDTGPLGTSSRSSTAFQGNRCETTLSNTNPHDCARTLDADTPGCAVEGTESCFWRRYRDGLQWDVDPATCSCAGDTLNQRWGYTRDRCDLRLTGALITPGGAAECTERLLTGASFTQSGEVSVRDVTSGAVLWRQTFSQHTIVAMARSHTSTQATLVALSSEPRVHLFNMLTGVEISSHRLHDTHPRLDDYRNIAFEHSLVAIPIADLVSLHPLSQLLTFQPRGELRHGTNVRPLCVAFLSGTRLVSGATDRRIRLWNIDSVSNPFVERTLQDSQEGHTDWIRAVAITPDGESIVSGDEDGHVILWNIASGQATPLYTQSEAIRSLTVDNTYIVSGAERVLSNIHDNTQITVYHRVTSQRRFISANNDVLSVHLIPGGERMVVADGARVRHVRLNDLTILRTYTQPGMFVSSVTVSPRRCVNGCSYRHTSTQNVCHEEGTFTCRFRRRTISPLRSDWEVNPSTCDCAGHPGGPAFAGPTCGQRLTRPSACTHNNACGAGTEDCLFRKNGLVWEVNPSFCTCRPNWFEGSIPCERCGRGFQGNDCQSCHPDYTHNGNQCWPHNSSSCSRNTQGQLQCTCTSGFTWNESLQRCDQDSPLSAISSTCTRFSDGSINTCTCISGWQWNSALRRCDENFPSTATTCTRNNDGSLNICSCSGDTVQGTWGYTGDRCETHLFSPIIMDDSDSLCSNHIAIARFGTNPSVIVNLQGSIQRTLTQSSDALIVLMSQNRQLLVALLENLTSIRIWNRETGSVLRTLSVNTFSSPVIAALSPNGDLIAIVSSARNAVFVYNTATGSLVRNFSNFGQNVIVYSLAITPDGQDVVLGLSFGSLRAYNLATGSIRFTVGIFAAGPHVNALDVTFDNQWIIGGTSTSNEVVVCNRSGGIIRRISTPAAVNSLAVTRNSARLVLGMTNEQMAILDFQNGSLLRTIGSIVSNEFFNVRITEDNQRVLSHSVIGGVNVWNIGSGQRERNINTSVPRSAETRIICSNTCTYQNLCPVGTALCRFFNINGQWRVQQGSCVL